MANEKHGENIKLTESPPVHEKWDPVTKSTKTRPAESRIAPLVLQEDQIVDLDDMVVGDDKGETSIGQGSTAFNPSTSKGKGATPEGVMKAADEVHLNILDGALARDLDRLGGLVRKLGFKSQWGDEKGKSAQRCNQ